MKKILVIEDNRDLRENTAEILELADYEVFTAENGRNGVEVAISIQPDLVVCDIMMPELDGFEVLNILHNDEKLRKVPFIFLSAKAEKSEHIQGMQLGASEYISKPFDTTYLLTIVERQLKKVESLEE